MINGGRRSLLGGLWLLLVRLVSSSLEMLALGLDMLTGRWRGAPASDVRLALSARLTTSHSVIL